MKKSALKKLAAFAAAGVLAAGVLAGCAGSGSNSGSDHHRRRKPYPARRDPH